MAAEKKQELLGAYLIVGDDALKRETVLTRLNKRLEAYGDMAFNADSFDGETASGEEIAAACNTVPFASDKRLVTVVRADKLRAADADPLVAYLKAPNETTVLALVAEKLAKNTRLYKAVAALGAKAVIDCALPKSYQLPAQVSAMAKTHGATMSERAAARLVELVGEDTVRLDGELERMALEKGAGAELTEADVDAMVARTNAVKPWKFVDAFSERDLPLAVRTLNLLGDDSSPFALITMCANRIRELLCTKALASRRGGETLAQALKMPDWRVKNHAKWAQRFTQAELIAALSSAVDAELAMKSGRDADEVFLEWAIGVMKRPAR